MKRRHWLLVFVIGTTALCVPAALALAYSAKEMFHEGLTYSQWYEGAIRGYYGALQAFIGCLGASAVCWMLWFYARRPRAVTPKTAAVMAGACVLLALVSCALLLWAIACGRALDKASAAQVESLAPYIRACGVSRAAAQAALEATIILGIAWLKKKPAQDRPGPDQAEER